MRIPTLDEFIDSQKGEKLFIQKSEYVSFPGFESLYIRYGPHYIKRVKHQNVFVYSNATASKRGGRTTQKLLKHLLINHSEITYIIFECILNEFLVEILEKLAFDYLYDEDIYPPSLFKDSKALSDIMAAF